MRTDFLTSLSGIPAFALHMLIAAGLFVAFMATALSLSKAARPTAVPLDAGTA